MDRPWSVICGELDRATGRRFPPIAGRGRGRVMPAVLDFTFTIRGTERVREQLTGLRENIAGLGRR